MLEHALLVHELVESRRGLATAAAAFSTRLKDPGALLKELEDLYLPGRARKERTPKEQALWLRSLSQVNWGELFVVSGQAEAQSKHEKHQKGYRPGDGLTRAAGAYERT